MQGLISFILGFLLAALGLFLSMPWMTQARGGPIVISINENNRYYRNTGTITLYDPFIENKILGRYKFVTGGAGRGSLPFGKYEIGTYRDDPGTSFTNDSQRFRRRWMIKQPGLDDGEADGDWSLLELHSLHSSGRTAGCLGVAGGDGVWDDFVAKMNSLVASVGVISFEIAANPDGIDGPSYVAARHRPHHPSWHRHKNHHVKIAHRGKHKEKHRRHA